MSDLVESDKRRQEEEAVLAQAAAWRGIKGSSHCGKEH
jgi:hypothetical protein